MICYLNEINLSESNDKPSWFKIRALRLGISFDDC